MAEKREWTVSVCKYSDEYWIGEDHYNVGPIDGYQDQIIGIRHREDATLVAAAPDLLEALEALVDFHGTKTLADLAPAVKKFPEILEAARAAIAKARDTSLPENVQDEDGDWHIGGEPE